MLDARHCEQSAAISTQRVAASRAAWGWLWPITINQSPKMLAFFSLIFPLTFTVFSAIF